MLTYVVIGVVVLIAAFVILAAMQPSVFRITRSAHIQAPASAVFEQVNDLRKWDAWSPWAKLDPDMKTTYSGPRSGTGASQAWIGNKNVGEGSMTITDSVPDSRIGIRLDFIRPFTCTNEVEFSFQPDGDGTLVTWAMTGHNKFINKAVCLVMNMDKMCGGQFEQGLSAMKDLVEGTTPQTYPGEAAQSAV